MKDLRVIRHPKAAVSLSSQESCRFPNCSVAAYTVRHTSDSTGSTQLKPRAPEGHAGSNLDATDQLRRASSVAHAAEFSKTAAPSEAGTPPRTSLPHRKGPLDERPQRMVSSCGTGQYSAAAAGREAMPSADAQAAEAALAHLEDRARPGARRAGRARRAAAARRRACTPPCGQQPARLGAGDAEGVPEHGGQVHRAVAGARRPAPRSRRAARARRAGGRSAPRPRAPASSPWNRAVSRRAIRRLDSTAGRGRIERLVEQQVVVDAASPRRARASACRRPPPAARSRRRSCRATSTSSARRRCPAGSAS